MQIVDNFKKKIYSIVHFFNDSCKLSIDYDVETEEDIIIERCKSKDEKIIPQIIWLYWEDVNVPELVLLMVEQIGKVFKGYEVNLLTRDNVAKYLPNLEFPVAIPLAHKSDVIRLNLLYLYGGVWIDSSVIISEIPAWLNDSINANKYDLIGYYRDKSTLDKNYPIIENWFLACPAKNELIKAWLDELLPIKNIGIEAYYKILSERSDYLAIKQNIDNPTYLLAYLAMQIALRKNNNYNLFLKKSEASAFLYQEKSSWAPYKGMSNLIIKKMNSNYPSIIKLTKLCRLEVEYLLEHGFLTRHSLFNHIFNIKK